MVDVLHIWQSAFAVHQALKVQSIILVIASSENYDQLTWKKREKITIQPLKQSCLQRSGWIQSFAKQLKQVHLQSIKSQSQILCEPM